MRYKRVTLIAGHYGSGKTNIAVNMALDLAKQKDNVAIADLDIINPYYRTLDSRAELEAAGVRLIVSPFANSNLDIPALPQEMYAVVDDLSLNCIIDVGGDDTGAVALGRLAPKLREEGDYDMYLIVNRFRPLTRTAKEVAEVRYEIEAACGLKFTGVINDSNLGADTTAETVLSSVQFGKECAQATGLPLEATTVESSLMEELAGKVPDLFPMKLQKRPIDL
ncbi:MAG: hypothetical protein IKR16_03355 [Firmicutes bacterium]|nr:hypothetical protein [Bacillota bacterium]